MKDENSVQAACGLARTAHRQRSTACRFRTIALGTHRCEVCGFTLKSKHPPERIHRRCLRAGQMPFAGNEQLGDELTRYVRSGQATRPDAEIQRCLAVCRACELFTGNNCRAMDSSCAHRRDWIWALVGFGSAPKTCPRGLWENSNAALKFASV
jgi:hypothetical protein